jgi:hypothetical protein
MYLIPSNVCLSNKIKKLEKLIKYVFSVIDIPLMVSHENTILPLLFSAKYDEEFNFLHLDAFVISSQFDNTLSKQSNINARKQWIEESVFVFGPASLVVSHEELIKLNLKTINNLVWLNDNVVLPKLKERINIVRNTPLFSMTFSLEDYKEINTTINDTDCLLRPNNYSLIPSFL